MVLHCLADAANVEGVTPLIKIEKIAQRCNISRRAVFRFLARLEDKGFIKRKRNWDASRSMEANSYILDLKRYFPRGDYQEVNQMWVKITKQLEAFLKLPLGKKASRITPEDVRMLQRISEAFLQKNAKTLYLVTNADLYEETIIKNFAPLKEAALMLSLPIHRFEYFRKPFLK